MENKELKENNIDNKYGIEYTKVRDYYMPNLVLEKEEKIILNKYGRLRLKFLKENKKAEYTIMFMNGTLNNHLKEIQETAEEKVNLIVEQLKKENNLTEEMKNTDQLYWVSMMNNFKDTAEEIILKDFKEYEHTWRFGLGYGDFPLELQGQFLDILDAPKRIGVCVNSSMMLTPTKSVTCVIGLGHNLKVSSKKNCDFCNFKDKCQFRKQGTTCS